MLVTNGSIEINGVAIPCTSWSISGGPELNEGVYAAGGGGFLGRGESQKDYTIEVDLVIQTGRPVVDFDFLATRDAATGQRPTFTLVRNFVGGERAQFPNCQVAMASEETVGNEGEMTRKVKILASGKLPQ